MIASINTAEFLSSWERTKNAIDGNMAQAWNSVGASANAAQREHGYQNNTGKLSASMVWRMWESKRFAYRGQIKTSAPYARWVNDGTGIYGPHGAMIIPRKASHLVFFWPKAGGWVFARSVRGMRAAKFANEAVRVFESTIADSLNSAIDAAARA